MTLTYQVLSLDRSPPPRAPGVQSIERGLTRLRATLAAQRGADAEPSE